MAKVLLVEDDPLLIDIYTTKLKQSGFEVVVVEKGEQAFQTVLEEMPDVVLLDIVLPHVDGWDILKSLKERAETKNIQVVILSNLGQKEEIEKGLELGAALYLIKAHYTPSEVVEEVNKLIAS
jgi:DNA-binding response OmpR family regulator